MFQRLLKVDFKTVNDFKLTINIFEANNILKSKLLRF
jgi:hypothetical protein